MSNPDLPRLYFDYAMRTSACWPHRPASAPRPNRSVSSFGMTTSPTAALSRRSRGTRSHHPNSRSYVRARAGRVFASFRSSSACPNTRAMVASAARRDAGWKISRAATTYVYAGSRSELSPGCEPLQIEYRVPELHGGRAEVELNVKLRSEYLRTRSQGRARGCARVRRHF